MNRRVLKSAVRVANAELGRQNRPPINPRLTPHSLRHTFASNGLRDGAIWETRDRGESWRQSQLDRQVGHLVALVAT